MARMAGLVVLLFISFIIWAVKSFVGGMTGNRNLRDTTFQQQTQKTMDTTAHGLNSLEKMWDKAKNKSDRTLR